MNGLRFPQCGRTLSAAGTHAATFGDGALTFDPAAGGFRIHTTPSPAPTAAVVDWQPTRTARAFHRLAVVAGLERRR